MKSKCVSCANVGFDHVNNIYRCKKGIDLNHTNQDNSCPFELYKEPIVTNEIANTKLSPNHYSRLDPQPIAIIKKWFGLPGCLAHVFSYLPRAGFKNGESERDDIKKAINWLWYYLFDCFPAFPDEISQDRVVQSKNK